MTVAAAQLPVFGKYPAGLSVKSGVTAPLSSGVQTSTTGLVDIVDIRSRMTKIFTAVPGDTLSVGQLFSGSAPSGSSIAGYKVALRADGALLTDPTGTDRDHHTDDVDRRS